MNPEHTKLWTTVVGSHVWNMNRPDSDTDKFTVYIVPTVDVLSGKNRGGGAHFTRAEALKTDEFRYEIGKVVDQLLDGNINFIIGTISDVVLYDYKEERKRLRELVLECCQSKAVYGSIEGLAKSNYIKYVIGHDTAKEYDVQKKCNLICRSLLFGISIMNGEGFKFTQVKKQTPEDVVELRKVFKQAKNDSKLPDRVDEAPFRDYLLNIRMRQLQGDL